MRIGKIILLFCLAYSSCEWKPYPKVKYEIEQSYRDLISPYQKGDTMIFKSSQNIVDSFVISDIDSTILDKKGYFINPRNSKSISIYYKQIPVDKWQESWYEGGTEEAKKRSRDGLMISIVKFPDTETTECYFNFKEFGCSKEERLFVNRDTIEIDGLKITDYYKIENCMVSSQTASSIKVCFSTVDKGLVAFTTNDGILWTKQK